MSAAIPPYLSVVVATFQRPDALRTCLAHLCAQDYPASRYEIIVVDDGSERPPTDIVAEAAARRTAALCSRGRGGPGAARNTGARRAAGQYLAFTDDDCRPSPGWLTNLSRCWSESPSVGVGGRTVNALPDNLCAATSQHIVDIACSYFNRAHGDARFFAANNLAFPADRFREVGGFDDRLRWSEDRDLCDRWRHAGHRLVSAPDAIVRHAHGLGFASFCQQHFGYGRGASRYHRLRRLRGTGRLRDDITFYADLPAEAIARIAPYPWHRRWAVAALLGAWQASNAAGYAYQQWQDATRGFPAREPARTR